MNTEPKKDDAVVGEAGLEEDIPCPQCTYNLRGLMVPRCPECGHGFEWSDIPAMRPTPPLWNPLPLLWSALRLFSFVVVGLALTAVLFKENFAELAISFVIMAIVSIPFAAGQTVVEYAAASPLLGRPTWRMLVAWWAGIMVGYGVCGLTFWAYRGLMCGFQGSSRLWHTSIYAWWLFAITGVESLLVQIAILTITLRHWGLVVSTKRLVMGCGLAKLAIAAIWVHLIRNELLFR